MSEADTTPGPVTKLLLRIYLAVSGLGALLAAYSLVALPDGLSRLDPAPDSTPEEVHAAAEAIRYGVADELPLAGRWLASDAAFYLGYDLDRLRPPTRWVKPKTPLADRVRAFNASVDAVRDEYVRAATLLLAVYALGLVFGALARGRARLGTSLMLVVVPVMTAPNIAQHLVDVNTENLLWAVSPLILAGGGVLVIRITHAAFEHALRTERDHWLEIWMGLILTVVGTGVTLIGITASSPGTRVLGIAVVGALCGVWRLLHGVWGLLGGGRKR